MVFSNMLPDDPKPAIAPPNEVRKPHSEAHTSTPRGRFFRVLWFALRFHAAWMLSVLVGLAQTAPPQAAQDPIMSLMLSQPRIDVQSPVIAVANMEPPVIRPGESATYRVSLNALEQSIQWPEKLATPPGLELRAGAQGQIMAMNGMSLQPFTSFNYRVHASHLGQYTFPEFKIKVYDKEITVPATQLLVSDSIPAGVLPAQELSMELSSTNPYVGQAVKARLLLPGQPGGQVQGMGQVQINGEGFIVDQGSARPHIEMATRRAGVPARPVFVHEVLLTPIATGKLTAFAQAFTGNNRFVGGIVIAGGPNPAGAAPQYTLVDSDPVQFQVRPLPREGELQGFSGAVGTFALDKPELSTNEVSVGEPLKLKVKIYGEGNLARMVPPPSPRLRNWDIFLNKGENTPSQFIQVQGFVTFNYTLVPLTENEKHTPPIPFSAFDPKLGAYADLTIPEIPITVHAGATPANTAAVLQANSAQTAPEKEPVLSGLATSPGLAAGSLLPLEQQLWFPLIQMAPATALLGLWSWDRRRRFLEQHPEVVLRRRARRALHRERRILRRAARRRDEERFARAAINAMRVGCAPHYPAEARALVGADILAILAEGDREGTPGGVVRRFFAATDKARFAAADSNGEQLIALKPQLEQVLELLEAGL